MADVDSAGLAEQEMEIVVQLNELGKEIFNCIPDDLKDCSPTCPIRN